MIDCVARLIEVFKTNSVEYCHWKSSQHLDLSIEGDTDLDVLIRPQDFNTVRELLVSIGFIFFEVDKARRYPFIYDFLCFDYKSCKIVHLHLHTRLNIGPKHHKYLIFPHVEEIIRSSVEDEEYTGLRRIRYDYELILLIIRQSIKFRSRDYLMMIVRRLKPHPSYRRELEWLVDKVSFDELVLAGSEILEQKDFLSKAGIKSSDHLLHSGKIRKLRRSLLKHELVALESPIKARITRWRRELVRIVYEVMRRIHITPFRNRRRSLNDGLIFSFVGGDGSGKSSVSQEVFKLLERQMNTKYVYLGSGDGTNSILLSFLKPLHKLLHKLGILSVKGKMNQLKGKKDNSKENKIRKLLATPWSLILLYDRFVKFRSLRKYLRRGYILITDRYPQSSIHKVFDGPKSKVLSKKEQRLIRKYQSFDPNIFRFECDPATCVMRKDGEVTLEQAEYNLEQLKKIKEYNSVNSIRINAENNFDEIVKECMAHIFRKL